MASAPIFYPRAIATQAQVIDGWRARTKASDFLPKPAVQTLYQDLAEEADAQPQPVHLGFRTGLNHLHVYLNCL